MLYEKNKDKIKEYQKEYRKDYYKRPDVVKKMKENNRRYYLEVIKPKRKKLKDKKGRIFGRQKKGVKHVNNKSR